MAVKGLIQVFEAEDVPREDKQVVKRPPAKFLSFPGFLYELPLGRNLALLRLDLGFLPFEEELVNFRVHSSSENLSRIASRVSGNEDATA